MEATTERVREWPQVRIHPAVHEVLQEGAVREGRSVTNMLDRILRDRLGLRMATASVGAREDLAARADVRRPSRGASVGTARSSAEARANVRPIPKKDGGK